MLNPMSISVTSREARLPVGVGNLSMNPTKSDVIRFTNRNGTTSWRVTNWLHGLRLRKNFQTRQEAAAEKPSLEIQATQSEQSTRPSLYILQILLSPGLDGRKPDFESVAL
jgi:hypothetical protein